MMRTAGDRRERGSALFIAVMMLTLMGFLGLAALDRVTRDEQVAGHQNRARTAFYAAEAGIAEARRLVTTQAKERDDRPNFPSEAVPRTLADAGLFDREGGNLPRYFGDPSLALAQERCDGNITTPVPICFSRKGPSAGGVAGMSAQVGNGGLDVGYWHIGVVGESPDGSRARVSVLAERLMADLSPHYNR